MATPLVAIDVYEYAYYVDYHSKKNFYVGGFMEHIDWNEVSLRFKV